jgi:AcrR family transcriptional regulator
MSSPLTGKKARTQAKLIEAAYAEVVENGFAAASLDAIARRAGMTKGAIYSNYRDKAELLMAVRDAKEPRIRLRFEAGATLARQMELLAEAVIDDLPRSADSIRFVTDYHRYASADANFHAALALQYERMFGRGAAFFSAYEDELSVSPRDFAVLIQTLIIGLAQQSILTPGDMSADLIRNAFRLLGEGAKRGPGEA